MTFFERALVGKQIDSVWVDSEVTCLTLADGTVVTVKGWVVIEPRQASEPGITVRETAPL